MNNRVFISDFINVKPPIEISQEKSIEWLIDRHSVHTSLDQQGFLERKFRHYGVKKEKIATRFFAIKEVAKNYDDESAIYSEKNCDDMAVKSNFFTDYSINIFDKFYSSKNSLPDHLIHVTCTGYVAPSAPQVLVSKFEANTKVTHAYHMGCYASFPAVRTAASLVDSGESKRVDVVHTEACSLHMDPREHTPEQIVIQTLFADGNIRYSLSASNSTKPSFELISQREFIIPHTEKDMRWELRNWGFAMTLSREVPEKIASFLPSFLEALSIEAQIAKEKLLKQAIFAVHPGGPKIIDSVAAQFDLREEQVRFSKKVLHDRGNMSSATLPHVWEEIINANLEDGHLIVSLAFGPGLSIFGAVFRYRKNG